MENDMRNMTPAERAVFEEAMRSMEHAGYAHMVCSPGSGACLSCNDKQIALNVLNGVNADPVGDAEYAEYVRLNGPWY